MTKKVTECKFCTAASINPCEADWIPSYWDGDKEVMEPVCPDCADKHLQYNPEHGDLELRRSAKQR